MGCRFDVLVTLKAEVLVNVENGSHAETVAINHVVADRTLLHAVTLSCEPKKIKAYKRKRSGYSEVKK